MEKLPFDFKCTVDTLTLEDYLYIYRTLDEDEYPIIEVNGKKVRNNYPLDKHKRTKSHMKNLQQKVVKYLTNLPTQNLSEDLLIEFCMNEIYKTFSNIENLIEPFTSDYKAPNFTNWTFYRWIVMEQRITKGSNIMDGVDIVDTIPGVNWILPITYGDFTEDSEELKKRYDYFLKELPLKYSLGIYRDTIKLIENIKSKHTFVYNGGGSNSGQNMTQHFKIFGWTETLRGLVTNSAPFGNYKETKEAPLFEVLEFLNINASYVKAENADHKAKSRK